jgi:hypothetical protein
MSTLIDFTDHITNVIPTDKKELHTKQYSVASSQNDGELVIAIGISWNHEKPFQIDKELMWDMTARLNKTMKQLYEAEHARTNF